MSATAAGITTANRANSCGENGLRGTRRCAREAASRQAVEGERVAVHRPNGNSLSAPILAGASSCKTRAGNDMPASEECAGNSLSANLLAANRLRGFGPRIGREKAAEIGRNLTRISTLVRWCKFNLVGAVGILVQFGVLFFLKSVLRFNYLAATALAVEVAVVHNFFWHERYTWADRTRSERVRLLWGGHPAEAKAQNLLSTEARARPKSKAAGKSARSTQTYAHKLVHECGSRECGTRKLCSPRFGRFLRFNFTTGLVSIAGNLGMMRVTVGRAHMNYLVANGVAIAVCSLVNFLVSDEWVFGARKECRS